MVQRISYCRISKTVLSSVFETCYSFRDLFPSQKVPSRFCFHFFSGQVFCFSSAFDMTQLLDLSKIDPIFFLMPFNEFSKNIRKIFLGTRCSDLIGSRIEIKYYRMRCSSHTLFFCRFCYGLHLVSRRWFSLHWCKNVSGLWGFT